MSNPHVPIDPTLPVHDPIAWQAELDDAWDAGYSTAEGDRRGRVIGLILAALSGAIIAAAITVAIVHAAPRSAANAILTDSPAGPSENRSRPSGAPRSGMPVEAAAEASRVAPTPVGDVGAPPSPEGEIGTAMESGVIAYAVPALGDRYLALPEGPGSRVTICAGVGHCIVRVSTDAGPDLAMQRLGRIADVSFVDFAWLCRCDPPSRGTMVATIERGGPAITAPPTDVEP